MTMEVPAQDTAAKPGLLTRVKSGFKGLARRFKKSPSADQESGEQKLAVKHDNPASQTGETPAIRHIRSKKRLIIGAAIGLLILLLTGIGFTAWKIFLSPPEHAAATPATADAAHSSQPAEHAATEPAAAPMTEAAQAEIDALRKKNEELQAQIEALKKEPQQTTPSVSPAGAAGEQRAPASSADEMTISNKDPKAAAQAMKEAIEAMNAGSGRPARKPAQ